MQGDRFFFFNGLQDLTDGLAALEESLKVSIKTLSSFDKYKQEVLSGNLEWTPMHKDSAFWRENVNKFEDNDFQVGMEQLFLH